MGLSITEQLIHNTIRIVTDVGTGTGFFFEFPINDKKVPAIVTNKHVVRDSLRILATSGHRSGNIRTA